MEMATFEGSYSELGIEPPEPLSILTGRNITPSSKKKSPESQNPKAPEAPVEEPGRPSKAE